MNRGLAVRKPFRFLPAIVWAILLDAIDYTAGVATFLLSFVGIGLVLDVLVDVVQTVLALIIFEDSAKILLSGGWEALPIPGIDIVPSFTAYVLLTEANIIK